MYAHKKTVGRQSSTRQGPLSPPPLRAAYRALFDAWGPQAWWPARTRIEIVVGAILTQNTAWTNVERAIARLRRERALNARRLHEVDLRTLAAWLRPAGTFNVKARRLRAFTTMLAERFGGSLDRLFELETPALRETLLAVHGIGPETADCILLYAANRPVFVVDAYTRRILHRHGWMDHDAPYDEVARLFRRRVAPDARTYNEYHALLVRLAKNHCRTRPRCEACPLRSMLPKDGPRG